MGRKRLADLLPPLKTAKIVNYKIDESVLDRIEELVPGASLSDRINKLFRWVFATSVDSLPPYESVDWDKLEGVYVSPGERKRNDLSKDDRQVLYRMDSRVSQNELRIREQEQRQDEYIRLLRSLIDRFLAPASKQEPPLSTIHAEIEDVLHPFRMWSWHALHADLDECRKMVIQADFPQVNRQFAFDRMIALEEEIVKRATSQQEKEETTGESL